MFFFMWQSAISLALGTVPALADILYTTLGVHYLIAGLALVFAGLLCDKAIRAQRARRLFGAALAALGGLFTLLLLFIQDMRLFVSLFFVATVFGFGANGVLTGGLFVSESTVNWHVANILKKTDVESRAELIERYGV